MSKSVIPELSSISPLFLDEWLEFNRVTWGLEPLRLTMTEPGKQLPRLDTVLYLDKRCRIVRPPLNAHLPIAFTPTPTDRPARLHSQWQAVAALLAEEFRVRGLCGNVPLSSEARDVREWQWRGFVAEVRYTFHLRLPFDEALARAQVRKNIQKAGRAGLVCERALPADLPSVFSCIQSTETRQRFSHGLSLDDLRRAVDLLGPECLRTYVCRTGDTGEAVAVGMALHANGGEMAVDLIASTQPAYLPTGAAQLLIAHKLEDLARRGATVFDFVGANLPTISASKLVWGGELVPYYSLRERDSLGLYPRVRSTAGRVLRRLSLR